MEVLMPHIYPGYTCWLPLGQPFCSSLQGKLFHEYGSDLGVIVRWKMLFYFPLTFSSLSPNIIMICPVLIYLSCPYLKPIQKLFFPNTDWTHPVVSFLVHLLLPTLAFYSVSPTLAVTIDPTLILFLPRLSSFYPFIFFPKY